MKKILMSDAEKFNIEYEINPWMQGNTEQVNAIEANTQWVTLKRILEQFTEIEVIPSQNNLPDLVFTANAALLKDKTCILSRFRYSERQGEENIFHNWFKNNGYHVITIPEHIPFEGAGDALFSTDEKMLWLGYGFRSDISCANLLTNVTGTPLTALQLINPYFYHLDTCFCPLPDGFILYYPHAFDSNANDAIENHYPSHKRIIVDDHDAQQFTCNAVCIETSTGSTYHSTVIINGCSDKLKNQLNQAGFDVIKTPVSEFMKSGGATKCLTLQLT